MAVGLEHVDLATTVHGGGTGGARAADVLDGTSSHRRCEGGGQQRPDACQLHRLLRVE